MTSFWFMAIFPSFFGHFEDFFFLPLFLLFFPHIWSYLWNYLPDWTEIFCGSRFWPRGAAHQISAFKVEGCRRYWVVRLTCKWCGWAATLCNHNHILQRHWEFTVTFTLTTSFSGNLFLVGWADHCTGTFLIAKQWIQLAEKYPFRWISWIK